MFIEWTINENEENWFEDALTECRVAFADGEISREEFYGLVGLLKIAHREETKTHNEINLLRDTEEEGDRMLTLPRIEFKEWKE
jgi:hypothetical protein